jgi:transcriptional regulator with XRE-family HTH domain
MWLGVDVLWIASIISFQQIQKYEKGTNPSRLQQFSEALGVPPSYFFEGAPAVGKKQAAPQEGELSAPVSALVPGVVVAAGRDYAFRKGRQVGSLDKPPAYPSQGPQGFLAPGATRSETLNGDQ